MRIFKRFEKANAAVWLCAVIAVLGLGAMSGCGARQVASSQAAIDRVTQHLYYQGEEIRPDHVFMTQGPFRLKSDASGAADKNDRLWQVLRTSRSDSGKSDAIFWVDAKTGEISRIFPEDEGAGEADGLE